MKGILITSSVLILTILLIRFLFRSTIERRVQYALWLLVALRLLAPVSIGSSSWSVASMTGSLPERVATENIVAVVGGEIPQLAPHEPDPSLPEAEQQELYRTYQQEWKDEVARFKIETGGTPITVQSILRAVWYGGMAVMALWFLAANLRFARRLRRTRVALETAQSRYPVYLCDDIASPCLFGLLRPAIYVTSAAAKDATRLRYVIAHEETHARHLDPLWSLLRSACLVVYWFNPLVWLAAHCSKTDCELACDEGALARLGEPERTSYGEVLLALIPVQRGESPMLAATTMAAGKRQMKDRIARIAQHRRPVAVALVFVLALSGVACAATFAGAEPRESAEEQPSAAKPISAPAESPTGDALAPAELLSSIAGEYWFLSGAGGWHSALFLEEDGSFSGEFFDSDADTVYYCDFRGRFGDVRQVDEFTYAMRLLDLTTSQTDGEVMGERGGVRYIGSFPYGMEGTEEFLVYLPGTPVSALSESFRSWYDAAFAWAAPYSDTLDTVGLCNASQEYGWFPATLIGMDDASRLRSLMESVYTVDAQGSCEPISLWFYPANGESAVESIDNTDARLVDSYSSCMHALFDREDLSLEPADLPWGSADVVELRFPSSGDRLLFREGENYVRWLDGSSAERGFRLVYGDEDTVAGDVMCTWYKEAEQRVLGGSQG